MEITVKIWKWVFYLLLFTGSVGFAAGLADIVASIIGWDNPLFDQALALIHSIIRLLEVPMVVAFYVAILKQVTQKE